MKRVLIFIIGLSLLVFALSGVSYGWQGRMAGMGDPYGLVEDESDFLIMPAKIAQGTGLKLYGHYRFTYTDVMDWDYDLDWLTLGGVLNDYYHFDTSGQEYTHNALVGAAFPSPIGPGRMGVFFTYDGMRGNYDGDEDRLATSKYAVYDLTKDFDNFALRLLYGLPAWGGGNLGFELGMAYRDELQETWWNETAVLGDGSRNFPWSWGVASRSLFPLMIPYDSEYWELLWRTGLEVPLAPMTIKVNVRGGYIVCSDNSYTFEWHSPVGTINEDVYMDGNVDGWRVGGDIWVRVPGGISGLTFPFLFSIDHMEKNRDGDGIGSGLADEGSLYDYKHKEEGLDIKAGGGFEMDWGPPLVAVGLYYNYLKGRDDINVANVGYTNIEADSSEFPSHQEHLMILRMACEWDGLLRVGLHGFYGWVDNDFEYTRYDGGVLSYNDDVSLAGYHWGIGGSVGTSITINIPPIVTLEPFINGGWQQFDLDGDGHRTDNTGAITRLWEMDLSRSEWYIGGGMSIVF